MKIAVITDSSLLEKWQIESLEKISINYKIFLILDCINTKNKRNYIKNLLYYAFNFFIVRNSFRKKILISKINFLNKIPIHKFNSLYNQNWQKFPQKTINLINDNEITLIIKFGMGLLNIDNLKENIDIISYHHGDPEFYRGKAPCFFEILLKSNYQGIVIQKINNKIDKGQIIAQEKIKLYNYSYKKSLKNCYYCSPQLLEKALNNISRKHIINKTFSNYINKLPTNLEFINFIFYLSINKLKRIIYFLFYYKKWQISIGFYDNINNIKLNTKPLNLKEKNYLFFADPFFVNKNQILIEGFNYLKGAGEILHYDLKEKKVVYKIKEKFHLSYPFCFIINNNTYIFPESSNRPIPFYYNLNKSLKKYPLKGLSDFRIIDPTLFNYNSKIYLFCNLKDKPSENLYLFFSNSIDSQFIPHKLNPVVTDITSSRMAGNLIYENNKIYRLGQNNSKDYGDGISIKIITNLNDNDYSEIDYKSINIAKNKGPHTFNTIDNQCVFDHYEVTFNLFSFMYRFIQLISQYLNIIFNGKKNR